MNGDLIKVLSLLAACVTLFIINKPRMDVVALLVIILLPLSGIISLPEVLAGFSDPNVILIAALFVIGEGLVRTGVTYHVGDWLVKKAGKSETRLMVLLMLSVAGLGAFMSSTGVVAVFIPVVMSVCRRLKISPGRLMMPLSFAGLTSGMITLVATPPNMVMDSALKQAGSTGFSFFSFTPVGLIVLALGVGYMLIARHWLVSKEIAATGSADRRGLSHFISDYRLEKRGFRFRIERTSPLLGMRLEALNLRREHGANIIAVERPGRFRSELLHPTAKMKLMVDDVLLVDFFGETEARSFQENMQLKALPLRGLYFMERSHEVGMAEVSIPPESALIGKTILDQSFRSQHALNVVGLRRASKAFDGNLLEEKLKMGDILLVAGPWKAIRRLQGQMRDFVVLSLPSEVDEVAPALSQSPYAIASLMVMVGLMVSGAVPNVLAALIACLLMGLFRCVDMESAYKSIHWQSLILIVGMMPFAHALQSTGGVDMAVKGLMSFMQGVSPTLLLASLFAVTAVIGLFISNTATAVLMAPIALSLAYHLEASPLPFAMTVAVAASSAFMTPVSSPVNTLVMGPGNYRFVDFVKIGVPFTLLVMGVTVVIIPRLFPL